METEHGLLDDDGPESEWEYEYDPNETEVCVYNTRLRVNETLLTVSKRITT